MDRVKARNIVIDKVRNLPTLPDVISARTKSPVQTKIRISNIEIRNKFEYRIAKCSKLIHRNS